MYAVMNPDFDRVIGRYDTREEAEAHIARVNDKYPNTPGELVVVEEPICPTCGQTIPA